MSRKVFEDFGQVDGSPHANTRAAGLGVPLSKRLIEMHSGQMWLESQPGAGHDILFHLADHAASDASHVERIGEYRVCQIGIVKRCLLIEPDPLVLRLLQRHLSEYEIIDVKHRADLLTSDRRASTDCAVDRRARSAQRFSAPTSFAESCDFAPREFTKRASVGHCEFYAQARFRAKNCSMRLPRSSDRFKMCWSSTTNRNW